MDASTYIAEQIPLLQSLHAQLALPPSALADDTARIDAAVRAAIISVVRSREDEVAEWEAQIADGKRALASLARAVGEQGRCVVYGGRRESEADEVGWTQLEAVAMRRCRSCCCCCCYRDDTDSSHYRNGTND